jgi:cytochrome b561
VDYAHLAIGAAMLVVALVFLALAFRGGRWRLYFPWAAGRGGQVVRDLAGLLRGRMPRSEGGGLNTTLQGFVLLALLGTAATGAGWFLAQGTEAALAWRAVHATCSHVLGGLVLVHAVTALAHVIDLARG